MRNKENEPKKPRAVDLDRIRFFSLMYVPFSLSNHPQFPVGFSNISI